MTLSPTTRKLYRFVTGEHYEEGGYLDGIPSSFIFSHLNFIVEELFLDIEDIEEIIAAWEGITCVQHHNLTKM